jgi:hypothetical protein
VNTPSFPSCVYPRGFSCSIVEKLKIAAELYYNRKYDEALKNVDEFLKADKKTFTVVI